MCIPPLSNLNDSKDILFIQAVFLFIRKICGLLVALVLIIDEYVKLFYYVINIYSWYFIARSYGSVPSFLRINKYNFPNE